MKKYITAVILFCLMTGILLTSCSSGQKQTETGSWQEHEVKLPEGVHGIFDIRLMENGTVRIAGLDDAGTTGTVWDSDDEGKSWRHVSTFTKNIRMNQAEGITTEISGYLSPRNQVFCVAAEWEDGNDFTHKERYYIVENEKSREIRIDLEAAEGSDNGVYHAEFAEDGSLIIQDGFGQLYKVNPQTGKVEFTFLSGSVMDLFNPISLYEDRLYTYTDKGLKVYSLKTGKKEEADDAIKDFQELQKEDIDYQRAGFMVTRTQDGPAVYSIDAHGLKLYQQGKAKVLLEGNRLCLKDKTAAVYDCIDAGRSGLFFIVQTMKGGKLYHYRSSAS